MNVTTWLENTSLAMAINEGLYTYPAVISLHSLGLGLLIGTMFIVNIRVLGGFPRLPFAALEKVMWVAAFGFVVNALSGISLFVAKASTFLFESPFFLVKISFITVGVTIALTFRLKFLRDIGTWEANGQAAKSARIVAAISLVVWSGAIISGRLMAYMPG